MFAAAVTSARSRVPAHAQHRQEYRLCRAMINARRLATTTACLAGFHIMASETRLSLGSADCEAIWRLRARVRTSFVSRCARKRHNAETRTLLSTTTTTMTMANCARQTAAKSVALTDETRVVSSEPASRHMSRLLIQQNVAPTFASICLVTLRCSGRGALKAQLCLATFADDLLAHSLIHLCASKQARRKSPLVVRVVVCSGPIIIAFDARARAPHPIGCSPNGRALVYAALILFLSVYDAQRCKAATLRLCNDDDDRRRSRFLIDAHAFLTAIYSRACVCARASYYNLCVNCERHANERAPLDIQTN